MVNNRSFQFQLPVLEDKMDGLLCINGIYSYRHNLQPITY